MDFLRHVLVFLHLLGMAALVGGWLGAWVKKLGEVPSLVVWGARAQIVTGLLLVGLLEAMDKDVNHAKIGVKLALAVAAAAGAEIGAAKDRKGQSSATMLTLAGGAGLAAMAVATLWK